ncbi:MAG: cation:proton antiporter, partial [Spirochaetaceae bacterium]
MTLLVLQLAAIVISAKLLGYLFERHLRQPRVLGELAAGMLIGPYALGAFTLPLLHAPLFPLEPGALPVTAELYGFAVVASIVLLFLAGLETDLPTFLRFSGVGSAVGIGGVVTSFAFGAVGAWLFLPGVDSVMDPAALFLGTLSTATSVGVTARILSEQRKLSSPEGVTILAAAVLDDVIGIILLAVVIGLARAAAPGDAGAVDWRQIGIIAGRAFGFWVGSTVIGILIAPRLTRGLKRTHSLEVVASVAFGISLLLAGLSEMAGLAMIIGAYVTGLALSRTDVAHEIRERMEGLSAFLVPVFFCVMGMLVDFTAIGPVAVFGLIFTGLAAAGKLIGAGVPALISGFTMRGALRIGAGMQPRGEVTLIIAGIGLSAGAIGQDLFGVAIMTLLITTVIAPPALVASFRGGSGYRRTVRSADEEPGRQIRIPLPGATTADFLRGRVLGAFRSADFFVTRVDFARPIYRIRRDNTIVTLAQEDGDLTISMRPEDEHFVRLLVLEELVELTDMMERLKEFQSPGSLGQSIVQGLFGLPDPPDPDEPADP